LAKPPRAFSSPPVTSPRCSSARGLAPYSSAVRSPSLAATLANPGPPDFTHPGPPDFTLCSSLRLHHRLCSPHFSNLESLGACFPTAVPAGWPKSSCRHSCQPPSQATSRRSSSTTARPAWLAPRDRPDLQRRRWRGGVAEGRQGRRPRATVPWHARWARCWRRWCPLARAHCPRRTRCWRRSCANKVGRWTRRCSSGASASARGWSGRWQW